MTQASKVLYIHPLFHQATETKNISDIEGSEIMTELHVGEISVDGKVCCPGCADGGRRSPHEI